MTVTGSIFTKLTLAQKLSVKYANTEFNQNPTNLSAIDTGRGGGGVTDGLTDGRTLFIQKDFFTLILKVSLM